MCKQVLAIPVSTIKPYTRHGIHFKRRNLHDELTMAFTQREQYRKDVVFVKNLPNNVTPEILSYLFSSYGRIRNHSDTGMPKISLFHNPTRAVVNLEDEESASKIIQRFH
ncbi:unnamed protein product, partial [Didymodactylos carnosus]